MAGLRGGSWPLACALLCSCRPALFGLLHPHLLHFTCHPTKSHCPVPSLPLAGITWVLSEQVVHMELPAWQQRCGALAAWPQPLDEPRLRSEQPQLWEWLQHQRGLAALGWLPRGRRAALEALQVGRSAVGAWEDECTRVCLRVWLPARLVRVLV